MMMDRGSHPIKSITFFDKGVSTKGSERGVGLALVKQQVENLGGSIAVESEPGIFTQFFVQIPGRGEVEQMINVLIIDDDAMVAELNRRYVAQIPGFQCCGTASTLEKAKEIIFNSDTPIDLILLDIYMQKRTGSIYCLSCITRVAKVM